jgi:Alw26I/Eco31I/Esp3I family type II restriction m6 adenine DNA methyltransferase
MSLCKDIVWKIINNIIKYSNQPYEEIEKVKGSISDFIKNHPDFHLNKTISVLDILPSTYFESTCTQFGNIPITGIDIFIIFNFLHQKSLELRDYSGSQKIRLSSFNYRKVRGSYCTHYSIAYYIVKECIKNYLSSNTDKDFNSIKILEPCVGTGIFVIALVDYLLSNNHNRLFSVDKTDVVSLIENSLYCVDIDKPSVDFFKNYLRFHLKYYYNININIIKLCQNIFINDILLSHEFLVSYKNAFSIIFFNPPYELLKPNSSEFMLKDGVIAIDKFHDHKNRTAKLKSILRKSGNYRYSIQGMLNLYKLFIELTADTLSSENANIGFIVPLTLLGDFQCKDLRMNLLSRHRINSVVLIPEKNAFFEGITQAFSIVNVTKNRKTINIEVKDEVTNIDDLFRKEGLFVDYSIIRELSKNEVIIPLNKNDKDVINKISRAKRIGDLREYFMNLRGEIDLTKYKNRINRSRNEINPLVRGNSIGFYSNIIKIIQEGRIDYLNNEDIIADSYDEGNKLSHFRSKRIACQQISNLKTKKRLKLCLIMENVYLANSCNYLIIKKEKENELSEKFGITYESFLCLLNSSIYNWRFKLTSTNNHISNNELDDLTIPLAEEKKWLYLNLQNLFMKYRNCYINLDELEIHVDANVMLLFELTADQIKYLLKVEGKPKDYVDRAISISKALEGSCIHDHEISGLSGLDKEMINHVPPGGNWRDIPESVPSKRLEQIRRSGGRTTLYGRLRGDMPSYTISTYFNRPGNGTFIHPDYYCNETEGYSQNRLISFREAARLQSFKDSFIFNGTKGSKLKQIGNAVPPLFGFHIAKSIISFFQMEKIRVIDLFFGAGGLSHGFREAGCQILLGLDNFKHALTTYQNNTPEAYVIYGDIREAAIKEALYNKVKTIDIGIVIGGPPCQGYSHAGWRIIDDPRNLLFKEFVQIIKEKNPLVFLMENVEGMLTINSGKTYVSMIECFKEIGYDVIGKTLNAAEYGIPQRRKRVFIIGSRKSINKNIFPQPCFKVENDLSTNNQQLSLFDDKLSSAVTVDEAISDLPYIIDDRGDFMMHTPFPFGITEYQAYMKGIMDFETFYSERRKRLRSVVRSI